MTGLEMTQAGDTVRIIHRLLTKDTSSDYYENTICRCFHYVIFVVFAISTRITRGARPALPVIVFRSR